MSVNTLAKIENPFVKGSVPFQNFNSNISYFSSLSDDSLSEAAQKEESKINNWMNYSSTQIDSFEQTLRAIKAVILSRKQ